MRNAGRMMLMIAALSASGPASAGAADLCASLKSAWTAAKTDPASIKDAVFPGAERCSFSDDDLRCYWHFAGSEDAYRTYKGFEAVVTACFAPLRLSPVHKVLHGVETTSLEPEDDREPNVDIFYPPGGSVVGISIVTAE